MQVRLRQKPGKPSRWWVQGLLSLTLAGGLYAAQPEAALKVDLPAPTRSEFNEDPKFGKDPFFPNSLRRQVNEPGPETVKFLPITKIKLQGISGSKDNRLAILNNRTFASGEEAEMKVENQSIRIRCAEIRARSVMVSVNGQPPQELFLGQRF